MATRSTIGYETADGGYVGVYAHYDGYPENMGPALYRMHHADVVIMVSRAIQGGGIRCVNGVNDYELYDDGPIGPVDCWPECPEEYAYRKRLDGRLEIVSRGYLTPIEWSGR